MSSHDIHKLLKVIYTKQGRHNILCSTIHFNDIYCELGKQVPFNEILVQICYR